MRLLLTLLVPSLFFAAPLWAESFSENSLPEITVVDSSAITTAGTSVLDRQTLQSLPQGDGAITDLLKVLPGIQFSESDNSSLTGGEILPAEISISGGRVYDNNFMIDGISNNSLIDPTSDNPYHINDVPGHSQELFLDSSLLERIMVQRSNISARYSGFTGGIVEMETRNPGDVFSGSFGYRTTRSEWSSFHVDWQDRENFESSESADSQPEFRKYNTDVSLDVPVNDKMGFLLAYSQSSSEIPLRLLGETESQYRKSENILVKYRFQPSDTIDLSITAIWTPYADERFILNSRDSGFTDEGGGFNLNAKVKQQLAFGNVEGILGWRQSENSRQAPANYYAWDSNIASTSWGKGYADFSQEGGYGDVDNDQESLTFASHLTFVPLVIGITSHEVVTGLTFERTEADYRRKDTTNITSWLQSEDAVCQEGDPYCVAGEQVAYYRKEYLQDHADAEITMLDLYLEDSIKVKNITFRPGLHLGYNDLMKNMDYAARAAVFYDVRGDGRTVLSAGANRYYGKTFLTYSLNEEKEGPHNYLSRRSKVKDADGKSIKDPLTGKYVYEIVLDENQIPVDWADSSVVQRGARVSQLKTPYVDEWMIGLEQSLFGGLLTLEYLNRNSEDELSTSYITIDNGEKYYELTNNGEGRHEEVTFTWERRGECHFLLVDATWQDSETSNEDYADHLEDEDLDEIVWYNDHSMYLIELPRPDYNREWSANLIYSTTLPHGFSFTNIIRYRSGYEAIGDTGENYLLDGEKIDIFDDISYPSATTFDWKIEWEYPVTETQTLTISADITNVFNRRIYTGIEGRYQMGRQLWVGVDYSF